MNKPVYSVVIPVYNSTATLPELVNRLQAVFTGMGESHEVIFVDDGSPNPDTWPMLGTLSSEHTHVRSIRLARNFGKAGAVMCGLRHAEGQWIVTMDDDLQQAPEDIPQLAERREHDVVIGAFANTRCHSPLQRLTSWIKNCFDAGILGRPKGVRMSPFKLIRSRVVQHMLAIETPHPFIPALMLHATRDMVQVDVTHHPRAHGKSAFSLRRRLRQFANLVFGNSSLVLQAVAVLGVLIACFSFLYGAWLVYSYLVFGRPVPGWTSIMLIILTQGGIVIFSIGVIGEYLIRIIEGVEKRPPYLIREKTE